MIQRAKGIHVLSIHHYLKKALILPLKEDDALPASENALLANYYTIE